MGCVIGAGFPCTGAPWSTSDGMAAEEEAASVSWYGNQIA
jgi:hypothetical protein